MENSKADPSTQIKPEDKSGLQDLDQVKTLAELVQLLARRGQKATVVSVFIPPMKKPESPENQTPDT